MNAKNIFCRTVIAAAVMAGATTAYAVSVEASVSAATEAVSDTAITGLVKAKLATDTRLKGSEISVTTEKGVIVLSGKAPSAEAKAAAEEIAESADASVKVENRIQTPSVLSGLKSDIKVAADTTGEVVTDSWITTKVKSQLLADTVTKGTAMKVTTKDHIVSLKGTVVSQAEKERAIELASQTKGVTKVDASKLKVSTQSKVEANTPTQ